MVAGRGSGIALALWAGMATIWVSDREPGMRTLLGELMPEAEVLDPSTLESRLRRGDRPDALVIDGTQLLELPHRLRRDLLELPRLLICTGLLLASLPMNLVSGPGVAVMAKPFCVEDLEAAVDWVRDIPTAPVARRIPAIASRPRRPRTRPRALPAT
jgi:hypothetical protein